MTVIRASTIHRAKQIVLKIDISAIKAIIMAITMVAISVVKLFWSPQTTWMMLFRTEIIAQTIVTVGFIKKNMTPTMAATTDNTPKMVANGDGRIMNTPLN